LSISLRKDEQFMQARHPRERGGPAGRGRGKTVTDFGQDRGTAEEEGEEDDDAAEMEGVD